MSRPQATQESWSRWVSFRGLPAKAEALHTAQPQPERQGQDPTEDTRRSDRSLEADTGAMAVQRCDVPAVVGLLYEGGYVLGHVAEGPVAVVEGDDPLRHVRHHPEPGLTHPSCRWRVVAERCLRARVGGGHARRPLADAVEVPSDHLPNAVCGSFDDDRPGDSHHDSMVTRSAGIDNSLRGNGFAPDVAGNLSG